MRLALLLLLGRPFGMRLRLLLLRRLLLRLLLRRLLLLLRLMARSGPGVVDDRFVGHELVAVLLQDRAGEGAAAHHEDALVVLLQFVDQRDEVAIAADDGVGVDVVVSEGHLERVEGQVDVGAILVAARRGVALNHLHRVLGKSARGGFLPAPVRVSELGDDFAAFLQRVQHGSHVKLAVQCALDADFDVVEIDEDGDLQFLFHFWFLITGRRRAGPGGPPRLEGRRSAGGRSVRQRHIYSS